MASTGAGYDLSPTTFSPDGRHIVSGSSDAGVYVWEADRPDVPPTVLWGHASEVTAVAWSHTDFATLVSASDDTTVRVWRVDREDGASRQRGREVERRDCRQGGDHASHFSPTDARAAGSRVPTTIAISVWRSAARARLERDRARIAAKSQRYPPKNAWSDTPPGLVCDRTPISRTPGLTRCAATLPYLRKLRQSTHAPSRPCAARGGRGGVLH